MEITHYVAWVLSGLAAGWLVGLVMRGRGYGLVGDLVLGLLGGVVGGFVFRAIGASIASTSWVAHVIVAAIGGVLLVGLTRVLRRV